jgi:hypothetical protein
LEHPDQLNLLAREARNQGQRMVERLQQEWLDGSNRFDRAGETVLIAVLNERVVGVCGLNRVRTAHVTMQAGYGGSMCLLIFDAGVLVALASSTVRD